MLIYFFYHQAGNKKPRICSTYSEDCSVHIATPYLYIKDKINSSDKATTHFGSLHDWHT